jgi:hypothetical protein
VNVDSVSVCLANVLFLDILDNGNVDGGESARAVNLFGCHGCGCVNVVVLIWTRGSKLEASPRKSHVDAPTRSTFMQGCRLRPVPYSDLVNDLLT